MSDDAIAVDAALMNGVIPYLSLAGRTAEAVGFYARAFGAVDLGQMADPGDPGQVMHAQVAVNGGVLMLTDHREGSREEDALGHGHLQLVVADGQAWFDRAVAAGCTVAVPFGRQDWGDDWGMVRDPFGLRWAVLQPGPQR